MHTGFRSSELKTLKWERVDLLNGAVTVGSCYSKNDETRTLPLTADLATGLTKLKEERKPKPNDPVFTHDGKPWRCWKETFTGAIDRAKLENFRFHDLRHCYGSWLAMDNVPDKRRMELTGHKHPKMTTRYTHLSMEFKRQAVQKLPQFGSSVLEASNAIFNAIPDDGKVVAFAK
jgi:integrase